MLADHPNKAWVGQLLTGLEEGVRIGFNQKASCRSAKSNMQSAICHPSVVEHYLDEELAQGNIAGPFDPKLIPNSVILNRFGVIPKANKPGKWRLIVDLSYPKGSSVNDGIAKADSSMVYSSIEDAARLILGLGKSALLAKIDVASAFRIIPVHPADRYLLGMQWKNKVFIDNQLPFGLRSAPLLFNAYADALEWIFRKQGMLNILHYLDDFLVVGSPATPECQHSLNSIMAICTQLGVPLAMEKIEGPTTSLTFLGIQIDTEKMQARLPADKLSRLQRELTSWQAKKSCTRNELEHLIGVLQFACRVVPQGRPFLRRMINLLSIPRAPHHHIRLNVDFRSDLAWWSTFVDSWNGITFLNLTQQVVPSMNVFTDASGTFGCGALWGNLWLQGQWPLEWESVNIMVKELVPVVLACAMWGSQWSGHHVQFHIDNSSVVQVIKKGSSKEPSGVVMHLLRCLSFFSAYYKFTLATCHVAGIHNTLADGISRNTLSCVYSQVPTLSAEPTPIPIPLWSLLVLERPDWISNRWRSLFRNSILMA